MNAHSAREARKVRKVRKVAVRLTMEQSEIIGQAAALLGLSVSHFLVESALRAAGSLIREHERIKLAAQDSATFAEAILNPHTPNDALRWAFAQHDRQVMPGG